MKTNTQEIEVHRSTLELSNERLGNLIERLNARLELNFLNDTYFIRSLSDQDYKFTFDNRMRQFTVYNRTSRVVYLNISDVSESDYLFAVAANTFLISPPFLFSFLSITQTGFSPAKINPVFTAHNSALLSPGIYTIQ